MKALLRISSIIELLTGLLLIVAPNIVGELLLNVSLKEISEIILALICGCALITIGIACWLGSTSIAAKVIVESLLFYNIAIAVVVMYAFIHFSLSNIPFSLVACLHLIMAFFCFKILKNKS